VRLWYTCWRTCTDAGAGAGGGRTDLSGAILLAAHQAHGWFVQTLTLQKLARHRADIFRHAALVAQAKTNSSALVPSTHARRRVRSSRPSHLPSCA
jgi:hypothetical protein